MKGMNYKNLSILIFTEGYLNFNILGLILFALIMVILLGYIDKKYWNNRKMNRVNMIDIFYPFLLGHIFTNCRGSLMTTLAYTIGQFCFFISL